MIQQTMFLFEINAAFDFEKMNIKFSFSTLFSVAVMLHSQKSPYFRGQSPIPRKQKQIALIKIDSKTYPRTHSPMFRNQF